jgi:hypothetical protein
MTIGVYVVPFDKKGLAPPLPIMYRSHVHFLLGELGIFIIHRAL